MKSESRKYHNDVLQTYNAMMFETLLHKHHIISETSKVLQFEDEEGNEFETLMRGYIAVKDVEGANKKYFVEEDQYTNLPFKVNNADEIFFKDTARSRSILLRPINITPFNITPQKMWDCNKEFVDQLAPFKHSEPDQWVLNKLVALTGLIGKTFCGVCSNPEFGKSSIYVMLDALTQKTPVFQPRSVPGILNKITCDGNMVLDDIHACVSEVRKLMESFSMCTADNNPIYHNGALKSKNTKFTYDISRQSVTYLFNRWQDYQNPDTQFWNNIWGNSKAMESRFLCMKFEGKILEEFDKDFDIIGEADRNKMLYINIAKHLLYLKDMKVRNQYERRYNDSKELLLKGRHKIVYDEIKWTIDLYSTSQEEYDKLCEVFDKSIKDYATMIGKNVYMKGDYTPDPNKKIVEEIIE